VKYTLTKDANIAQVQKECPKAIEMLLDYGLNCANCFLNQFDNVEGGAKLHGMTDVEIDRMVNEINEQLVKEE
jgi:hybrid cluster-associated redox disulfide protein